MDVTIIGGGVIGLCTAYYLEKAGYEVTVIDRNDITDGCSFGNMGYISPSHFTPIATPGIIAQGFKWMMSSSSPFYIKPRLNLDLMRWGTAFYRSSTASQMKASMPHLNNLLQLSRGLMKDIAAAIPDFNFTEKGCWMLYKSPAVAEHERELAEKAYHYGLKTVSCTAAEVQEREPEVEVNVAGGVLYLDDAHVDPAGFMKSLHSYLLSRGVKFVLTSNVTGLKIAGNKAFVTTASGEQFSASNLVIANGSRMPELARMINTRLLMQPGKGYSMVYSNLASNLQFPSILVDDRTATAPLGNRLRIGGTMELSGHSDNILPGRVMAIYKAFTKYYPTMAIEKPDTAKAWYGYRPVSPDGMPYIGRHEKFNNVFFAGGHAMLGVSAAAGTGLLIEQLVSNKPPECSLEAFNPHRFR